MMFVFPPGMFAGFLGTAGLFHKPPLEIEVFGTTIGNGSDFSEVFKQHTNNLFILAKKNFERVCFPCCQFHLFAGKEILKILTAIQGSPNLRVKYN